MAIDPQDPRITNARPGWALIILAMPPLLLIGVGTAYTLIFGAGIVGRSAAGEQVGVPFTACPEARPLVEARVAEMGLSDATFADTPEGFVLTVTLPADAEVAAGVPGTLATPGHLEVRHDGGVLATQADLVDASVRLDVFMVPSVLLNLDAESSERARSWIVDHPEDQLTFTLDGTVIGTHNASNPVAFGELEIAPTHLDGRERMHATAAWAVVIDHGPLPCAVSPGT